MIPCLNEATAIERCVAAALEALDGAGIAGEVVVADNGSRDGSRQLAAAAGARVILEPQRGYGSALRAGFAAAEGEFIVMADADLTYDYAEVPRFVAKLRAGADMVIGDRMDGIEPGAMPWLHRRVGNPLLSRTLNLFFGAGVRDAHCGMRALRRSLLERLDLRSSGMELASEMVIRSAEEGLAVVQLPIRYRRRAGDSKLETFGDGWRHLRFLLVHSPSYLFFVPGGLLLGVGALVSATVLFDIALLGREWELHALVAACLLLVVGAQVLGLGICAHAYRAWYLGRQVAWLERLRARLRLEHVLAAGGIVLAAGVAICGFVVIEWLTRDLGTLHRERLFLGGATLVIVGAQTIFTAFLVSILGLRRSAAAELSDPLERLEHDLLSRPVEERAAAGV